MKVGLEDHIRDKHGPGPAPPRPKGPKKFDLTCPECGAPMTLRESRYGLFYGCSKWPECRGSHGAHPDGTPLGTPADIRTKKLRMVAHNAFDPLWRGDHAIFDSRGKAYLWMQDVMGMGQHEAHISRFDREDCKKLVEAIWEKFGE